MTIETAPALENRETLVSAGQEKFILVIPTLGTPTIPAGFRLLDEENDNLMGRNWRRPEGKRITISAE